MKSESDRRRVLTEVIRWVARVWAVASIGLILAFVVGEGFNPSQIKPREWVGLFFFPVGICAGMVLAWWKEGLGGIITVGSLLAFYLVHRVTAGTLPKGWAWWAFAAPGFVFLLSWYWSRRGAGVASQEPPATG
jgi:hypothetical protein